MHRVRSPFTCGDPPRSAETFLGWTACLIFTFLVNWQQAFASGDGLQVSVYCTAGDVQQHLATAEGRQRVLESIQMLQVRRLFLEGRRGDEYVSPGQLREIRDFFTAQGIHCSGGIATVPGASFGKRQTGGLDWLNWESPKTRADVMRFFSENAPLFDELIVDDFYCTGDISAESERARDGRAWGDYRRDLLVSLINPIMVEPARRANRHTGLIIKYPQWYDRFHLFGYDPPRMSALFSQVWVGAEVRDPQTRRMGFVQPTEGYMNFLWLSSVAGRKVRGAWFDHIECSAQNFVDQAYQSVLAGAQELTLFHLGDLMAAHPGDALLADRMPELRELAAAVRGRTRNGIGFYKPAGSDSSENMYLADYLGMVGLPAFPVAEYPKHARVAFLPVQAAADSMLLAKMQRHLRAGATLIVTPALLRALGANATRLAGIEVGPQSVPASADQVLIGGNRVPLERPVQVDAAVKASDCEVLLTAAVDEGLVPLLARKSVSRGQVFTLNVRTFSEEDFGKSGEWLLAPRQLGLPTVPQKVADAIRAGFLAPLGLSFRAPAGVELVLLDKKACVYSFREDEVQVQLGTETLRLAPHHLRWIK